MSNRRFPTYDRDHYIRLAHEARSQTFREIYSGISSEVKKLFANHVETKDGNERR